MEPLEPPATPESESPQRTAQSPEPSPHQPIQALSIAKVARRHCRERLLVAPLFWTARHVELLQCSFSGPIQAPPSPRVNLSGVQDGRRLFARFSAWSTPSREDAILHLVSSGDSPFRPGAKRQDMTFSFNSRPSARLKCSSLHDRREAERIERPPPLAAYVDRGRISRLRRDALYPKHHHSRGVGIALALYKGKLKKITPPDSLFDPYIVAILISLAQEQQRAAAGADSVGRDASPAVFPARVLVSSRKAECMHVYRAEFTTGFLDKLDKPAVPPSGRSSAELEILTVLFKPHDTLRDRISALLHPSE